MSCLQDENAAVVVQAIEGGIELLDYIGKSLVLPPTDFKVFSRYIFPDYKILVNHKEQYVVSSFLKCIGKLALHGKRFIESGMIEHLKHLCKIAEKEKMKKGKSESLHEATESDDSVIDTYETDAQDVFQALYQCCLDFAGSNLYPFRWIVANHIHEYFVLANYFYRVALLGGNQNLSLLSNIINPLLNSLRFQSVVQIYHPNIIYRKMLLKPFPAFVY